MTVDGKSEPRWLLFTPRWIRMISRTSDWARPAAELVSVTVVHNGERNKGYRRTTIRLVWQDGKQSLRRPYDPGLTAALRRVLPSAVAVDGTHEELDDPSLG